MGYFIRGVRYPSVPRDAINQQVIQFRRKFPHYADYAKVTFEDLLSSDEKKDGYILPCIAYPQSDLVIEEPRATALPLPVLG